MAFIFFFLSGEEFFLLPRNKLRMNHLRPEEGDEAFDRTTMFKQCPTGRQVVVRDTRFTERWSICRLGE